MPLSVTMVLSILFITLDKWSLVRPEFSNEMAIQSGRHPIKEAISKYVPNEVYAGPDASFVIVTGPNMSGKSTYLRKVALLSIMAQSGSFIPAEYACFRIADAIFSRLGNDDSLEVCLLQKVDILTRLVKCFDVYGGDEGYGVYSGEHDGWFPCYYWWTGSWYVFIRAWSLIVDRNIARRRTLHYASDLREADRVKSFHSLCDTLSFSYWSVVNVSTSRESAFERSGAPSVWQKHWLTCLGWWARRIYVLFV